MIKILSILCLAIVTSCVSISLTAQTNNVSCVDLRQETISLTIGFDTNEIEKILNLKVGIQRFHTPRADTLIRLELIRLNPSPRVKFEGLDSVIAIHRNSIPDSISLRIRVGRISQQGQLIFLGIIGCSRKILITIRNLDALRKEKMDSLKASRQAKGDSVKKFRFLKESVYFSLGTRLNFLNEQDQSSFYYDISIFKPCIKNSRFGLDFGLYQTGTKASPDPGPRDSSGTKSFPFQDRQFVRQFSKDSVLVSNITYTRSYVSSNVRPNIAIYAAPTYKINEYVFALINFEYYGSSLRFRVKDKLMYSDTVKTSLNSFYASDYFTNIPTYGTSQINSSDRNFIIGIGAIIRIPIESFVIRIKPVYGIKYLYSTTSSNSSAESSKMITKGFYKIDVRLINVEKFSFKIGAEFLGDRSGFYGVSYYFSKTFLIGDIETFFK